MSVTAKFVTTTSDRLNSISVANGQVIALSDRDAWFYDMENVRHMIASNVYVTSLPATGAENTLYVLAANNGDSGLYIYSGSSFVKIAGLKVTSATEDSAGNTINTTYVKSISAAKSGSTVTFTVTKGDNSTSTFTVTDSDTTYDVMKPATASAAGTQGLVPPPAAGDQEKFLAGDATWKALGSAASKNAVTTVAENNTGLPTSGAVYSAVQGILADAKTYTDTAVGGVVQFNIEVVDVLPTSDIKTHTIYLVPNGEASGSNVKTEYLYINSKWEIIGSTTVDLTPYAKVADLKNNGNATTPVYFDADGKPVAISYSINKTVPADAKFTDTTYTSKAAASGGTDVSLVTTGEKAAWNAKTSNTGTVTKVSTGVGLTGGDVTTTGTLKAKLRSETALTIDSAAATQTNGRVYPVAVDKTGYLAVNVPWTDTDTTYGAATQSAAGLMSAADKKKLDGVAENATANTGTVTGPSASTANGLAAFSDTAGKVLKKAAGAGSATKGIYLNANGVPTEMTYALNKDVPADAKFTDTTYTPASAAPVMDGTAKVGTSEKYAREDHVHPVDTSRAPTNHAATATTYGAGNASNYGHVKLSDAVNSTSGVSGGTAATPAAVKAVQDDLDSRLGTSVVDHTVYLGSVFSVSSHTVSV